MSELAPRTLVLAALDFDEPLTTVENALKGHDWAVVRVALRGSDSDAENQDRLRQATLAAKGRVVVGGFSLGARLAAQVAAELGPLAGLGGVLGLGYPFHRASEPAERPGLAVLLRVEAPIQIIQGTRDRHGSKAFVDSVRLPEHITMRWLEDGNHRFVPRARHWESHAELLVQAASSAVSFGRSCSR